MINYKLKFNVLNNPDFVLYRKNHKIVYCPFIDSTEEQRIKALKVLFYLRNKNPVHYLEFERLCNSRYHRVSRLKKRIGAMIQNEDGETCLFLTLTFRDDILSNTSVATRRRYVQRFLKSLNCNYCANIDFGKKNHREHYHCVVQLSHIDYSLWNKPYGRIDGIQVRCGDLDNEKIAKYIAKLTNHAIKETTKNSYIIYNRKKY